MTHGNLLHTSYPYMRITRTKHFDKLAILDLYKKLK